MPDNQQESTVFNDCGEKITIKKTGVTSSGNHNFSVHHRDTLLDDEVIFTLYRKDKDIPTIAKKISASFLFAGWITSQQECTVIAEKILEMLNK